MHDDQFEVSLVDEELMAEVELLTQVIITASESDAPLTLEQIDALLGIARPDADTDADADPNADAGATAEPGG